MYANDIQLYNINVDPSKSQVILFGNSNICKEFRRVLEVRVNGLVLPIVDSVRDLGLVFDNSFSQIHFKYSHQGQTL